jgi:alkylation response protein AidB-like acyl-CoA dehydrogenase
LDFELTAVEKAFRQEIREFLDKEVNEHVVAETESMAGEGPYSKELIRKMGARKLLTPTWPEKYGGRGLSFVAESIKVDELTYHRGPFPLDAVEIGNTLLLCATESQKDRFLPGISKGEIEFALGYTEPDAGSDVASIRLRAVDNGNEFILNGQKIYNTEAHFSDYHWLLTRTDPTVPKHKGLSLFMVDLKSPGITIRPLHTSAGLRTNEVFYEDVHVPKENMVGEKNGGWTVIMRSLYAGGAGASSGSTRLRFEELVKYMLNEKREVWSKNPWIGDALADMEIRLHLIDLMGMQSASMFDNGVFIPYAGPVAHIFSTESRKYMFNMAMEMLGPFSQLSKDSKLVPLEGTIIQEFMDAPRFTIVHGSSEIQRINIARALGLPKK